MEQRKISTFFLIVFGGFFLCFLLLLYWNSRPPATMDIVLQKERLTVYVAKTLKQTYIGLGGRDDLGGKDGMLFLYEYPAPHGIVMRNMRFSIDVVWLYEGKVVDIAPALPLEPGASERELQVYTPRLPADMVLELPAGWASSHSLQIGDTMNIPAS